MTATATRNEATMERPASDGLRPTPGGEAGRATNPAWWARGLLFENCNCRLLCHCHVSFTQPADEERCIGYWAIRIDEGAWGDVPLAGLHALVLGDSPQVMADGDWTQALYLDLRADAAQRPALEAILDGRAGGPWAKLGALVSRRLPTRWVAIRIEEDGRRKAFRVEGADLVSEVEAIKAADRTGEVRLENCHNQIHGSPQVLAFGTSRLEDNGFALATERTHALWSRFAWQGP
jgi:hypothetical protein